MSYDTAAAWSRVLFVAFIALLVLVMAVTVLDLVSAPLASAQAHINQATTFLDDAGR